MTRSPQPSGGALPTLAIAVTLILWASAFVGIRALAGVFDPVALTLGRLLVGSAALGLWLLVTRTWVRPSPSQWWRMLAIGVLWYAVYNVALNAGERLIDAGTAAMLIQISPILIAVLSVLFLGERVHVWLLIGMVVALAGVVVIGAPEAGGDLLGIGLCLIAALTYSIALVVQKPLAGHLPAIQVTWIACTTAVLATAPWAGALVTQAGRASLHDLGWLVYLGVFPTAIAFSTYGYALRYLPASRLGVTTYLVPPIAALISLVLLREVPPVITWIGGAMCLLGVALTRRQAGSSRVAR